MIGGLQVKSNQCFLCFLLICHHHIHPSISFITWKHAAAFQEFGARTANLITYENDEVWQADTPESFKAYAEEPCGLELRKPAFYPDPETNSKSTRKWMIGIRLFPFWGPAYFQGLCMLVSGSAFASRIELSSSISRRFPQTAGEGEKPCRGNIRASIYSLESIDSTKFSHQPCFF